jgi:hypothetical protein
VAQCPYLFPCALFSLIIAVRHLSALPLVVTPRRMQLAEVKEGGRARRPQPPGVFRV